ncbi:MAG: CbtB-domain containing protein [Beijerinckiaceae bacterium]|nr:CbtB-domain containing protein [Beijerinckiaceae bacterium]
MQPTETLTSSAPASREGVASRSSVVLQAAAAILLGVFVIGMVGFSQASVLHNAAHDTRHSNAFPCH